MGVTLAAFARPQPRERAGADRLLRSPRTLALLVGAGACLKEAWGGYISAVTSSKVVESSLGLFLIPLATALVRHEAVGATRRIGFGLIWCALLVFIVGRSPRLSRCGQL
ncbi:MAG: hypothetical protein ACRDQZ_23420 [Mycobacteriales bacterium]